MCRLLFFAFLFLFFFPVPLLAQGGLGLPEDCLLVLDDVTATSAVNWSSTSTAHSWLGSHSTTTSSNDMVWAVSLGDYDLYPGYYRLYIYAIGGSTGDMSYFIDGDTVAVLEPTGITDQWLLAGSFYLSSDFEFSVQMLGSVGVSDAFCFAPSSVISGRPIVPFALHPSLIFSSWFVLAGLAAVSSWLTGDALRVYLRVLPYFVFLAALVATDAIQYAPAITVFYVIFECLEGLFALFTSLGKVK